MQRAGTACLVAGRTHREQLEALQFGAAQVPVTCVPEIALWLPNSQYQHPG